MANISWRLTKGDCFDNWANFSPKNNAPDTDKQERLLMQKLTNTVIKIINNNQKTEIEKIIKQYITNNTTINKAEIEKLVKQYIKNNPQEVDIEEIIAQVIERQRPHETKQTKHIVKNAKNIDDLNSINIWGKYNH